MATEAFLARTIITKQWRAATVQAAEAADQQQIWVIHLNVSGRGFVQPPCKLRPPPDPQPDGLDEINPEESWKAPSGVPR